MKIIGAGLAGLLAGNMLRHRDPQLIEAQKELPNNHSAVLRFRTSAIGDVLNIPFKKVTMIKTHVAGKNLVADALAYSFKNTGTYRSDRSIVAGTTTADRYIAPPDLIQRMAKRVQIDFNLNYDFCEPQKDFDELGLSWRPIISTIPMPVLMNILKYPLADKIKFTRTQGLNIRAKIENCEAYVSLLVPDPDISFSRISITGNEMIIEIPNFRLKDESQEQTYAELNASVAAILLGIPEKRIHSISTHRQRYAKIAPIDDDMRKDFIYWATDQHGIFSLGRFATWRPNLLLDDLVQDIRLIDKWMDKKNRYAIARSR